MSSGYNEEFGKFIIGKKGKEELIEYLNTNYSTVLGYGTKGFMPVGEFRIKDIIVPEFVDEDYKYDIEEKNYDTEGNLLMDWR